MSEDTTALDGRALPPTSLAAEHHPTGPVRKRRRSAASVIAAETAAKRLRDRAKAAARGGIYAFTVQVRLSEAEYEALIGLAEQYALRPTAIARSSLLDGMRRYRSVHEAVYLPKAVEDPSARAAFDARRSAGVGAATPSIRSEDARAAQDDPVPPAVDDALEALRAERSEAIEAAREGALGAFLPASPINKRGRV